MTPEEAVVILWEDVETYHSRVQLYDAIIAGTATPKILERYRELTRAVTHVPHTQEEQRLLPPLSATPPPKPAAINLSNRSVGTDRRARQARTSRLTVMTHT
jgi:hypothetical protein